MTTEEAQLREFMRVEEHDNAQVRAFAEAMKEKLHKKRLEGAGGWNSSSCSIAHLHKLLHESFNKGDAVDIANFCMMIWSRQQPPR